MIQKIPPLDQLLALLQQVPYLASKNLYRVASHFLDMDEKSIKQFCHILTETKKRLKLCAICFCWQEKEEQCIFCNAPKRDKQVICVVETWHEVFAIEKTQGYGGVYHVLGGSISPLDGIGPEDLHIDALVKRIAHETSEIILATNQTPEGEATAAFIARKLKGTSVVVSCLARGLPVGSLLGSMDRVTVYKALAERRKF